MSFPSSCEQTLGRILDLHKISDLLGQRNDVLQTLGSWRNFRTRFWPRGHVPRGYSENEKERSWKAVMFRHKKFENQIKIEGVMASTLKIFQITQCMIHGP